MPVICQFERMIYPKDPRAAGSGFMIALYRPCGRLTDASGNSIDRFKAVGYCLPVSAKMHYDLKGRWSRNAKHGLQFEVEKYTEVIAPTREGVIAYLSSGQIKGIGPKTAQKIYGEFGENTLEILDQDPDRLLTVPGISEKKLKKIRDSYLAGRGARDAVTLSPDRMDEALLYTLADAERRGHLCMEEHLLLQKCRNFLDTEEITEQMLRTRMAVLIQKQRLTAYGDAVFRSRTAAVEDNLAKEIWFQLRGWRSYSGDLDADIDEEESCLQFKLAPKQREAVKMSLTEPLCVITGGPGTGKTSVQRVLLDLYRRAFPYDKIICCAPTGKAARRMEQSTGFPASTIHRALGLLANDDGIYSEPERLKANLVLVDEVSMVDVYLAEKLFRALPIGCRLILVGDSDQLPSVGPGAVLREIIASECVPVVRLDQVYRQKEGSRIAANARLIRHGNLSLEYGPDFQFYDSSDLHASAELIEKLYLQEVRTYGIDHVVLLSPYRQKTETGVNALNERIQARINPEDSEKHQTFCGKKCFRAGDKVMQTRNREDISNGDVGYITAIRNPESNVSVYVDFGDSRHAEYESEDLDQLDLAYACTVHKSQGSEFQSVIINLQCAHSLMLVRPLIYTAITRAKEKVIIVGDRKALCTAIRRTDTEQRGTRLALRIQELQKSERN